MSSTNPDSGWRPEMKTVSALFASIICATSLDISVARGGEPADFRLCKLSEAAGWLALGVCSAVAANRQSEIYVFHRGKHPLLCFDPKGNYLRSWGDDVIQTATDCESIATTTCG